MACDGAGGLVGAGGGFTGGGLAVGGGGGGGLAGSVGCTGVLMEVCINEVCIEVC